MRALTRRKARHSQCIPESPPCHRSRSGSHCTPRREARAGRRERRRSRAPRCFGASCFPPWEESTAWRYFSASARRSTPADSNTSVRSYHCSFLILHAAQAVSSSKLMRGADLPIQLLLSQIKPKLLGKRGSLAQVVILGIDNDAVHVKDNGVERKCGHGTLPNKRTPANRRPSHALIGDSNPAAYPAPPQCHLRCYRRSPSGLQP